MDVARSHTKTLEEMIHDLPPEAKQEAVDFVSLLKQRYSQKKKVPAGKPSFSWEGALADLSNQYTSVELQHKIQDLWIENVLVGHKHNNGSSS